MESPLVSIIVTSYNHSNYIIENLDSVKAQSYSNIELIVADDASSDNSIEVFEKWLNDNNYNAKKNFHKKNTGFATTLNECIEIANGKYVKIIAADDYLHPESIEKCVVELEKLGDEYGMVFTDFYPINDKNIVTTFNIDYNKVKFDKDYTLDKSQLLDYNCIIAPTVLIKKKIILETGKYKANFLLEDHDRWLRVNEKSKIFFINQKLAYYRVLETSISNTKHDLMQIEDIYLKLKFDYPGIKKSEINSFISKLYLNKQVIPEIILNEYKKYPFKTKRLEYAIKYKIPTIVYKFLNKFL